METVKVDVARFEEAIRRVGYRNNRALSIEMGYSDAWIRQTIRRTGGVPKAVEVYLDVKHGISSEEYKPVPQKKGRTLTTEEFRVLVKDAVREAVREIWEERRENGD